MEALLELGDVGRVAERAQVVHALQQAGHRLLESVDLCAGLDVTVTVIPATHDSKALRKGLRVRKVAPVLCCYFMPRLEVGGPVLLPVRRAVYVIPPSNAASSWTSPPFASSPFDVVLILLLILVRRVILLVLVLLLGLGLGLGLGSRLGLG